MPEIQIPSIVINILQVFLACFGAFVLALWVSMIVWTFRDARARSRDIFAVLLATLMVIIFGPLGLLIYFLLRPQVTLVELYERSLEEEALLQDLEEQQRCSGCSRMVEKEWIICPDCHTQLKKQCTSCHKNLNLRWNICPYCGTSHNAPGGGADLRSQFGPKQSERQTQQMSFTKPIPAQTPPAPSNSETSTDGESAGFQPKTDPA